MSVPTCTVNGCLANWFAHKAILCCSIVSMWTSFLPNTLSMSNDFFTVRRASTYKYIRLQSELRRPQHSTHCERTYLTRRISLHHIVADNLILSKFGLCLKLWQHEFVCQPFAFRTLNNHLFNFICVSVLAVINAGMRLRCAQIAVIVLPSMRMHENRIIGFLAGKLKILIRFSTLPSPLPFARVFVPYFSVDFCNNLIATMFWLEISSH